MVYHLITHTKRTIDRIKKEKDEIKKLTLLFRFICYMLRVVTPQELSHTGIQRGISWNTVFYEMELFSDKWTFSRVYLMYERYISLKKSYEDKNHTSVLGEAERNLYII